MKSSINTTESSSVGFLTTILLQTDLSKSNVVIPITIQLKDATLPEEWILKGATQPQSLKRL